MTSIEMIAFIDEFLRDQEDVLHGIEGRDCTKSRKYLEDIKKQLLIHSVVVNKAENCTNCLKPKRMKPNTIQMLCECDISEVELSSTYCKFCKQDPCERLDWSHPLEDDD